MTLKTFCRNPHIRGSGYAGIPNTAHSRDSSINTEDSVPGTCGLLKGRTVDISESGIAAIITIEPPLGEIVEDRAAKAE
jgi:hypothetical protein